MPRQSYAFTSCLFDTAFGTFGLLWSEEHILSLQWPEATLAKTRARLKEGRNGVKMIASEDAEPWVQAAIQRLRRHLELGSEDLASLPIDFSSAPPFHQIVYRAALRIGAGQTISYGALAAGVGRAGAARAVGSAMAKNPLPLIIPCHRVLAAGGKGGGFSAPGGLLTKERLLALEAAALAPQDYTATAAAALVFLKKQDPRLAALIERVGPCTLRPKEGSSVFAALAEAIVYQQLSAKAAGTIFGRFRQLFPEEKFPSPDSVLALPEETLRSAGLSRSKTMAIRDLAHRVSSGTLPSMDQLRLMSAKEVLSTLTEVRGIGRWTAEMLLIFDLGRINILPATDYGVRKGFAQVYGRRTLPTAEALEKHAQHWQPFASIASWYMWRALELDG